jgi:hypothetical protein
MNDDGHGAQAAPWAMRGASEEPRADYWPRHKRLLGQPTIEADEVAFPGFRVPQVIGALKRELVGE